MDKLQKLLSLCKCGVILTINDHRNIYQSAATYLDDLDDLACIDSEIRAKIIETDTIIDLHFYPDTPVGFYKIIHYDLDAALDEALSVFKEKT